MRRTVIAGLFGIHLVALAVPAHALYVYDMCGGTPSEGASLSCPPGDYYLVRPRYSDGTCDDWVCCPKNPGGPSTGYNCEQGVPPNRSAISSTAKKFLGPRVMPKITATPGTTRPTLPQTTAPVMRPVSSRAPRLRAISPRRNDVRRSDLDGRYCGLSEQHIPDML